MYRRLPQLTKISIASKMINDELLIRWTTPPETDGPFLRPFVCRGEILPHGAFIVGTNPSTPIYPSEISLSEYRKSLCSADEFESAYSTIRSGRGERADGRTRQGLRALSNWLITEGVKGLFETNVVPYPTKDIKHLKQIPIVHQSHWVFREVCEEFKPRLIVLHGKPAKDAFIDYVGIKTLRWAMDESVEELEARGEPLFVGNWSDGESYAVFVCRHLMYYGTSGHSYTGFKNTIKAYLALNPSSCQSR